MDSTMNLNQERSGMSWPATESLLVLNTHWDRNSEQKQDSSLCWETHSLAEGDRRVDDLPTPTLCTRPY